jgi:hypothetical protein
VAVKLAVKTRADTKGPRRFESSLLRHSVGLLPDARQIISRVGRGFGPPGAVAVALL